jgi:hypothetical protein
MIGEHKNYVYDGRQTARCDVQEVGNVHAEVPEKLAEYTAEETAYFNEAIANCNSPLKAILGNANIHIVIRGDGNCRYPIPY